MKTFLRLKSVFLSDIDECASRNVTLSNGNSTLTNATHNDKANNCSQVCNNTAGSYTCGCYPGYRINANNTALCDGKSIAKVSIAANVKAGSGVVVFNVTGWSKLIKNIDILTCFDEFGKHHPTAKICGSQKDHTGLVQANSSNKDNDKDKHIKYV